MHSFCKRVHDLNFLCLLHSILSLFLHRRRELESSDFVAFWSKEGITRLNTFQIATARQCGAGCDNKRLSAAVYGVFHLMIIVVVVYNYVCECAIGVDVRDGTTPLLISILSNVVMGCIVLGRQMNVDFSISGCTNTIMIVGMDARI